MNILDFYYFNRGSSDSSGYYNATWKHSNGNYSLETILQEIRNEFKRYKLDPDKPLDNITISINVTVKEIDPNEPKMVESES